MNPTEEIKARIDIVPFIEGYVRLARAGANFKALCPFHNERTPSFMVSPARQTWHCFGCGKGGDVFSFLMEIEGLEFLEALKILAERAGVLLVREAPQMKSERTRLLSLLEDAARFFEANLRRHPDVGVYLKSRGLTGETAKTFRVGFAEDTWNGLLHYLASRGYRSEEAEKAGLVIKSNKTQATSYKLQATRFYDRFRNRIIFPIADAAGRIVGFSGRIYEVEPRRNSPEAGSWKLEAKYINTPQTILYDKSKLLYAFDKAKQEIRKQNACVLVEGQMDALMAHQAGTTHAVAISGTALTPLHLRQIRRLCGSLIFAFDPDSAGIAANRRGFELAYEAGFEGVKIACLALGCDPAATIAHSPDQWREALEGAQESIAFFLAAMPVDIASKEAGAKDHAAKTLFPFLERMESHVARAAWLQRIARALRLPEESIVAEFARFLRARVLTRMHPARGAVLPGGKNEKGVSPPRRSRRESLEERLFGILFLKPHLVSAFALELQTVSPYHNSYGVDFLPHLIKGKEEVVLSPDASREASRLMLAVEREGLFAEDEEACREVAALLTVLKKEILKEKLTATRVALAEAERGSAFNDQERLLHQFSQLIQAYNAYEADEKKEKTKNAAPPLAEQRTKDSDTQKNSAEKIE